MQNNKLLTIVIPAYNMEKYLHRCLDSIIVESVMDRVQVIVVNDGSKDRTSEIAHEYANAYPNYIQIIDKENGNYGSCMNVGLSLAKGKYFRTLDADDWYDTEAYVKYVDDLEKTDADMIVSEYYKFFEQSGELIPIRFISTIIPDDDIIIQKELWSPDVESHIHVYCICYKTALLRASGMTWSEKVFYTDNEYIYWPLSFIKTIRFIPYPVYVYLIGRGEQSVSIQSLKKNFHSYDVVTNKIVDHYLISNHNDETEPLARNIVLKLLCRFYNTLMYNGLDNADAVRQLDAKLKVDRALYDDSGKVSDFRGHNFIEYFRNNPIKFFLFRIDYLIRSNKYIRRLLRKD